MAKQDYDKTIKLIEDILEIQADVKQDLEDGKISFVEGSTLVIKHAVKAVHAISNIKEIADEIIDTDEVEATEATQLIAKHFGGSDEAFEAVTEILGGLAGINQGVQKLLALRKQQG